MLNRTRTLFFSQRHTPPENSEKKFIEALDSYEKSLALTERHPAFFNMSEAKEARSAYERSVLEFTKQ